MTATKMFTPGTLLRRKLFSRGPLTLFKCLEILDDGAYTHGKLTHLSLSPTWLVLGAYHINPPAGLPCYYVLAGDGTHGWTSNTYALEVINDHA